MKNTLILFLISLITLPGISQDRKYQKSMLKSIEEMNKTTDRADHMTCVATFEELAGTHPDQYFPLYYAARTLINLSFEDSDQTRGDGQLDRANELIDKAMILDPEESELHVLKALLLLARITLDPMTRGPMYFEGVNASLAKAKSLNPENPRAYYLDGLITLNLPEFIGGGPLAAKPIFLEAAKKFESYQNSDPIWPSWGEEDNSAELEKLKDVS